MNRLVAAGTVLALCCALIVRSSLLAQEEVDVTIAPLNGSGVGGSATLQPAVGGTQVTMTLGGMPPGSAHANYLYQGSGCGASEYGPTVEPLTSIGADANGDAAVATVLDLRYSQIADGAHVIVVHAGATLEDDATPIACGVIPAASSQPTPAVTTAAPQATPSGPVAGLGGPRNGSDLLPTGIVVALGVFGLASAGAAFALRYSQRR